MKKENEMPKFEYPKKDSYVWLLDSFGDVQGYHWRGSRLDIEAFQQGHIFPTQDEAKFERERRKVMAELELFKEPEYRDWNSRRYLHFSIYYSYDNEKFYFVDSCEFKHNDIYFATKEDAQRAIDFVGEDRVKKYYLRIED